VHSKLVALVASAALIFSSTAVASAATTTEAFPGAGPEMSLEFTRATTRVVGPGALVFVKCAGSTSGLCTGTVTLQLGASHRKVPFSIFGGASQGLVVPLGSDKQAFARAGGQTALATASTAQPLGSYVETTGVLHIK
jgi:hypothetical protein